MQEVGLEVEAASPDRVVGLAALVGWRCVTGEVGHVQSLAMIGASLERHPKRKIQRFLEHRVLASTELSADVPLPAGWQYAPAKASCRQVLDAGKALGVLARDRFGQQVSLGQLLSDWASRLGVNVAEGMLWPVFTPIAVGMVQRSWFGDVSRWSPVAHGRLDMAPCRPSVGLLRHFGRQPVCYELPSGQLGQLEVSVWARERGNVRGYTQAHLIRSIRAGRKVCSQRETKQNLEDTLRFFFPLTWRQEAKGHGVDIASMPSPWTLERATVRLDRAAVLWNRSVASKRGPVCRYIAFDASPQHGDEIFLTVERVVQRPALL